MQKTDYPYDVFISHAVEDKIPVANELYRLLVKRNLKVWYSGSELSVGDHVTNTIHKSLDQCRFGVVIISPTYLSKIWALNEFFFLLTREQNGRKVILPVLYDITPEQLASRSTLMAEMFAIRVDKGLDHVADKLYNEIQLQQAKESGNHSDTGHPNSRFKIISAAVLGILIALITIFFLTPSETPEPIKDVIEQTIQKRIDELQRKTEVSLQEFVHSQNTKAATSEEVKNVYSDYLNAKSYYRNEYTLYTNLETIRSKKNVNAALSIDVETKSPLNLYDLSPLNLYRSSLSSNGYREETLIFYNLEKVTFRYEPYEEEKGTQKVVVRYENPIRMVATNLIFPKNSQDKKRHEVTIRALRPSETYIFVVNDKTWVLKAVQ